ncbi:hypothetical protein E3P92_01838 [Wallemia ichthyophaga]|nr:hypothetical protein E3P92_01838 [Wallemia ichthyophaga]
MDLLESLNRGNYNLNSKDINLIIFTDDKIFRFLILHKLNELDQLHLLKSHIHSLDDAKYADFLSTLLQINPGFSISLFDRDLLSFHPIDSLSLLNSAVSNKSGLNLFDEKVLEFLHSNSIHSQSHSLLLSTLTLIKLDKHHNKSENFQSYLDALTNISNVHSSLPHSQLSLYLEALSHLSSSSKIAHKLSQLSTVIRLALSSVQTPSTKISTQLYSQENLPSTIPDTSTQFTLSTTLANICQYAPPLTEEAETMKKLQKSTKQVDAEEEEYMSFDKVRQRNSNMLEMGITGVLPVLSKSNSLLTRRNTSTVYLGLTNDNTNRPQLLRDGAIKALLNMTTHQPDSPTSEDLHANQALAKMTITTPPSALYTPPIATSALSFLSPLDALLFRGSQQLQQFEAMMALTNVASLGADVSERVVSRRSGAILDAAQTHLLSTHTQLQRAAAELICNLVGMSEGAFRRYTTDARAGVHCALLLALSDAESLYTRQAAAGALAQLCGMSPLPCKHILSEPQRFLRVLIALLGDEVGCVHRALCILLATLEACQEVLRTDETAKNAINQSRLVPTLKHLIPRLASEEGTQLLPLLKDTIVKLKECGVSVS